MLLGHLLLGTICYCVIIATIVQMLLRTPKFLWTDDHLIKTLVNYANYEAAVRQM